MNSSRIPPLRSDLDYIPMEHQGEQYILIRDPLDLVREGLALSGRLHNLLILLDGTRTLADLQRDLTAIQEGQSIPIQTLEEIVGQLDQSFLLHSERFIHSRDECIRKYSAETVREAFLAGKSYPSEPEELRRLLDSILNLDQERKRLEGLVALMAPHIDLNIGARAYAGAYRCLKGQAFDRVVILGVGHQLDSGLFSLSSKDFSTPLGRVSTDTAAVQQLLEQGRDIAAPDDFAHRSEHSIEFQLLFLQHILPQGSFSIVPVLCGSSGLLPEYSREAFTAHSGPFLDALRELVTEEQQRTLILAGVDLSHTGPKFGHRSPARDMEKDSSDHDRALLGHLLSGDKEEFWKESARVRDTYHVCGFSALATLMEILGPARGSLLEYDLWHEEPTNSAVSFASAAFCR